MLEDTSGQRTPKTQITQELVNLVSANLASHDLTKATRAVGEKEIQELVTSVNRVIHESVCFNVRKLHIQMAPLLTRHRDTSEQGSHRGRSSLDQNPPSLQGVREHLCGRVCE